MEKCEKIMRGKFRYRKEIKQIRAPPPSSGTLLLYYMCNNINLIQVGIKCRLLSSCGNIDLNNTPEVRKPRATLSSTYTFCNRLRFFPDADTIIKSFANIDIK